MARQRSSARPVTRLILDAGFGLEFVGGDHGAGVDLHDLAASRRTRRIFRPVRGLRRAARLRGRSAGRSPALSSVLAGSLNPLTFLGATVTVRSSASARSWMAMLPGAEAGAGAGGAAGGGVERVSTVLRAGTAGAVAAEAAGGAGAGTGGAGVAAGAAALAATGTADSATVRSQMLERRGAIGSTPQRPGPVAGSSAVFTTRWKAGISSTGSGSDTAARFFIPKNAARRLVRVSGAGVSGSGAAAPEIAPENRRCGGPG